MSDTRTHRRPQKVLGSLAIVGIAAGITGLGTYGTFSDSALVDSTVESGILSLDLGSPGGIPHVIPVTTSGFLPGDSLTRALDLDNRGTVALSSVNLATTATPSSSLTTDQVNGLQLTLEQCSARWTQGGTDEAPTYTCGATRRTLYSGPVIGTADLPALNSFQPGATDHMIFVLSLPTSAGNDMQDLSATVSLGFTATQAPGTAR